MANHDLGKFEFGYPRALRVYRRCRVELVVERKNAEKSVKAFVYNDIRCSTPSVRSHLFALVKSVGVGAGYLGVRDSWKE